LPPWRCGTTRAPGSSYGNDIAVDRRILREQVFVWEVVLPPNVDRFALFGFSIVGLKLPTVAPQGRRRKVAVELLFDPAISTS